MTETPSSSATGGRPFGVPSARKESTSEPLLAVKVNDCVIHPVKLWAEKLATGVVKVCPPSETC